MKHKIRKISALLMAAAMMISSVSVSGFAEEPEEIIEILEPEEFAEDSEVSGFAESSEDSEESITCENSDLSAELSIESMEEVDTQVIEEEFGDPLEGMIFTDTFVYVNPLYQDIISSEEIEKLQKEKRKAAPQLLLESSEYSDFLTPEELAPIICEHLKNHDGSFVIKVRSEETYSKEYIKDVFEGALAHSGNPKEGDYLRWQYGLWKSSTRIAHVDDMYYFTVTFEIPYYTTMEQEAELDAEVENLIVWLGLNNSAKSDYAKIKGIYDYICENISYDHEHPDDYYLKYTAYSAAIQHLTVCQGYALLFYRLALESGIDARLIPGTGRGGAHGWNIVQLNEKYYNLDSTWDAGKETYEYFLRNKANFPGHVRYPEYEDEAFNSIYLMGGQDYNIHDYEQEHVYVENGILREATCCQEGILENRCLICNEGSTALIPKLEHSFAEEFTVNQEATCTKAGSKSRHCQTQGCPAARDSMEIPATGHDYPEEYTLKEAPTCTKAGSEKRRCQNPGCTEEDSRVIPAKGHSFSEEYTVDQSPTCTQTGSKSLHCEVCGAHTDTIVIAANGHNYTAEYTIDQESTIFAAGCKSRHCQVKGCSARTDITSIAKLDGTIKLTDSNLTMRMKQKFDLRRIVTGLSEGDKILSYKSSNPEIVSVSANGIATAGKVKGTAAVTITLKSQKQATVKIKVQKGEVKVSRILVTPPSLQLKIGQTASLKATVSPITCLQKVTFTSSKKKVAKVDKKGKVKALKKGNAVITIKVGKKKVKVKVQVK